MSAYTIHEITTRAELDAFNDMTWAAWWSPYMPSTRIARPIFGYTEADKARGIAASKEKYWDEFQKTQDPSVPSKSKKMYIYAKHTASGQVAGGVVLNFAQASPFPTGCPRMDLYWWPEGEEVRLFCEEMMNQVYTPRSMWIQRPHGGKPWRDKVFCHNIVIDLEQECGILRSTLITGAGAWVSYCWILTTESLIDEAWKGSLRPQNLVAQLMRKLDFRL